MRRAPARPFCMRVLMLTLLVCVSCSRDQQSLPYQDTFAAHRISEWTPSGGSWHINGDALVADAREGGAQVKTGSDQWSDYELSADMDMLGHGGSIGLGIRISPVNASSEAFHSYLINLRSVDGGLEIVRDSNISQFTAPIHLAGGVNPNTWYRVRALAVGCRVAVQATNIDTGAAAFAGFEDSDELCIRTGKVALRTGSASAAWKNVVIRHATDADLNGIWDHIQSKAQPSFPRRERELTAMRQAYLAEVPAEELHRPTNLGAFGDVKLMNTSDLVSIEDLRTRLWDQKLLRIGGVVTSTSPLYVQDTSGGILLSSIASTTYRSGDEIEVFGRPEMQGDTLRFAVYGGRFLSDRAPLIPLSVTATQAASGQYEGLLIDLSGEVQSAENLGESGLDLLMREGGQRFTVHVPYSLFNSNYLQLEPRSRVRVRGVCSIDRSTGQHHGTFVVNATSSSDVILLKGPPWWAGQRLFWLIFCLFLLCGAGIFLYGVEERTKLRIVQEERERLSHDMHDTLAQTLAGVSFRLQGILRSLQTSEKVPKVHIDDLKNTCDLVTHSHREASANIAALHPATRKEGDVLALLEKAVYSMLEDVDFPVIISSHGTPQAMSPVVGDVLFRVGREAIANALRHSDARSIKVQLHYRAKDVMLSVVDDGVGFQFEPSRVGFGIRSMTRRCDAIRAKIAFTTPPNGGCRVQVTSRYRAHRGLIRWVG